MRNAALRFLSRPVWLRVEAADTPFTCLYERGEVLELPIAHGDGRYVADPRTAAELETAGRVVWRYVRDNPNGSTNAIAGICNAGRNVVGIMPHPERRTAPVLGGRGEAGGRGGASKRAKRGVGGARFLKKPPPPAPPPPPPPPSPAPAA